ncbi:hypothetical protein [Paenibacillus sp. M2]|uniref:pPIWI-associating nuclease domain-containing protein n=1 Tax=Paenibacillus sp. M2 TaxID=3341793 RepID=UPI003989AB90
MNHEETLKKYLHEAKIYELLEKFHKQSYTVIKDYKEGKFQFDIFATHDNNKKIYIVVKSGKLSEQEQERVMRMAEFVKNIPNARFDLVVANLPRSKRIEIDGIENKLYQYLSNDTPQELLEIFHRTTIDGVCDVDIDEIGVKEEDIQITGTATVEVVLELGEDDEVYNSFPFEFSLKLDFGLDIEDDENNYISIDTSSFYE